MSKKLPYHVPSGNVESVRIRPYWKAYIDIFETDLTLIEKNLYVTILSWGDSQECFYSHDRLAKWFSCSRRWIISAIASLEEKGLLRVHRRKGRPSIYEALPVNSLHRFSIEVEDTCELTSHLPVNSLHTTCELTSQPPVNSLHTIRTIIDQDKNKLLEGVADAPTTLTLAESATPSPSSKPEPKIKAKKKAFPDEAYWADAFPSILDWMRAKGFNGSDDAAKTWFDQCVERMRDACEANPSKYRYDNWAAAFKNWNRDRLFKESSSDAWIVAVFQFFWNETRTPVEKPNVTDSQRAAVNQALKKLGDSWRTGLSEATERDRPFRLKEFRDQLQETK